MRTIYPACCLDFDDHGRVNHEIRDVSADPFAAEFNLECDLSLDAMTGIAQHHRHCIRVDALEKPFAELTVHFERRSDDGTCELSMGKRIECRRRFCHAGVRSSGLVGLRVAATMQPFDFCTVINRMQSHHFVAIVIPPRRNDRRATQPVAL